MKVLGAKRTQAPAKRLAPLTAQFRPTRRTVFLDTETLPDGDGVHTAFLVCAQSRLPTKADGLDWRREDFSAWGDTCDTALLDWLLTMLPLKRGRAMDLRVIGHNLAFDFMALGLHGPLGDRGWKLNVSKSIISETSRPFKLTYSRDSGLRTKLKDGTEKPLMQEIEFIDNMNWWAASLADLGKVLGNAKGTFDFGNGLARSRQAADDPDGPVGRECLSYCQQDVEVLRDSYEALERFMGDNSLGKLRDTIAATAMSTFLTRFLDETGERPQLNNHPGEFALAERSYSGGAVAARRLNLHGEEAFSGYQTDFVSMYASVMESQPMPVELAEYRPPGVAQLSPDRLALDITATMTAIAEVTLDVPPEFGLARYPKRTDTTLLFPAGHFRTTLAGPELLLAIQRGHVIAVHESATYHTAIIFDGYVKFFGDAKDRYGAEGNAPFEALAKIFSNGLYGKWAQTTERFVTASECHGDEYMGLIMEQAEDLLAEREDLKYAYVVGPDGQRHVAKKILGTIMVSTTVREAGRRTIMPIAAIITAHARQRLFDAAETAGWDDVVYCDTDSWVVTDAGYERMIEAGIIGPERGKLMPEMKIHTVNVQGLKLYELRGQKWSKKDRQFAPDVTVKTRWKGVSIKKDKDGNVTNRNPDGSWNVTQFAKFHSTAIQGFTKGVKVTPIIKTGKAPVYQKGTVSPQGLVEPFLLS